MRATIANTHKSSTIRQSPQEPRKPASSTPLVLLLHTLSGIALELGSHPKPAQIADALVKDGLAVEAKGVLVQVSQHPLYSFLSHSLASF